VRPLCCPAPGSTPPRGTPGHTRGCGGGHGSDGGTGLRPLVQLRLHPMHPPLGLLEVGPWLAEVRRLCSWLLGRTIRLADVVLAAPGVDRPVADTSALATSAIASPDATRSRALRRSSGADTRVFPCCALVAASPRNPATRKLSLLLARSRSLPYCIDDVVCGQVSMPGQASPFLVDDIGCLERTQQPEVPSSIPDGDHLGCCPGL
jgi:hypothetical protein